MKDRSCCFTEHRPNSLPFGYNEHEESCVKLKAILTDTIEKQITENGVTHFISGMAMGVDTFAAEAVLKLKEKYPQITLECAIPCETQAAKWSENWRERYYGIIARSDRETMLQTHYTANCMMKRNRYRRYHFGHRKCHWRYDRLYRFGCGRCDLERHAQMAV